MKRRDDISLDDVRASRPLLRPSGEEWVESERGRRVLERVLASDRPAPATATVRSSARSKRGSWWAGPRLVFVTGAVVVAALAVVFAAVLLARDEGKERRVASTATSATVAQPVSTHEAVAGVLPMYKDLKGFDSAPPQNGSTVLDQAVSLGLVPREAVSGEGASGPMTQGEYAVLLVRAFGGLFLRGPSPHPVDQGSVIDELGAIDLLRTAGVILPEDGDFAAAEPLTTPVEDRLIGRLQAALGYQPE
jgi:hypothetical protein